MGLSEYVKKNNFKGVVLGLSGGIDSALSAAIAVDALGKKNVRGIRMPSNISSKGSLREAGESSRLLNIQLETIDISGLVESYEKHLENIFSNTNKDITEENIQSRIRGVLLMAVSNKFGDNAKRVRCEKSSCSKNFGGSRVKIIPTEISNECATSNTRIT